MMVAACLAAAPVRTAFGEDADALLKKGLELRRQARDREALEVFRRAAQIKETARLTAQIAMAEQALGSWVDAEVDLKRALENTTDSWIQKNRALLEHDLVVIREHLSTVEVWGAPEGAEVTMDGKVVGRLGSLSPVRVASEEVALQVQAPGYADFKKTLHFTVGEYVRQRVDLRRLPPPLARADAAAANPGDPPAKRRGASPLPTLVTGPERTAPQPEPERPSPIYGRWWFWTLVGAVAIGAGTGAFLLVNRGKQSPDTCVGMTCTSTWN